ncbi:hypothetical protein Tco_1107393 [Tanacetum coccineum]
MVDEQMVVPALMRLPSNGCATVDGWVFGERRSGRSSWVSRLLPENEIGFKIDSAHQSLAGNVQSRDMRDPAAAGLLLPE